jgi:diguanylate cyclase (GGDEF)-like protein
MVFVLGGNPWLQASVQIPVYVASAGLMVRTWWRGRRGGPDRLLTLAAVAFATYFLASVVGVVVPLTATASTAVPVPSVLDGLFLLSYVLLALFLWRLGSRSVGRGRRDLLDTMIVLVGVAPLFDVLLVAPLLRRGTVPVALMTYLAYPVIVFALVAMTVRLGFVSRRRTTPHVLLAIWIALELVADLVYLYVSENGTYAYGQAWQSLWIVSATSIGALALHPRTRLLLERQTSRPVSGTRRLYLLAVCLSAPIATGAYAEFVTDRDSHVLFPAAVSLVLVGLLSLRLSGLMVDNAEQLRVQAELRSLSHDLAHQTLHDPLTGLGNRLMFAEHADHALAQRVTDSDRAAAVLLLDLDDFKTVNDTFGHDAGDRVLVEMSRRLEQVTRQGESIFRLGGDEFAFVMTQVRLADALRLADRIGAILAQPFDLGPRMIRPVASMGISIALDGQDRSTLLAEADMAMYDAKSHGSAAPSVFDPVLHREALDRHHLERDLRDAVEKHELRLLYQPIVRLAGNDIAAVEALVRWEHPTRGTISPLQFIPLAETNGVILEIGDWVMEESLRQLRSWDLGRPGRHLGLSVNVSPGQLADPDFVSRVAAMLRVSGVDPQRITLEITEAAFADDVDAMIVRMHELKGLGVRLAIDDFGTEYSSLSQLRRLPVDVLKIDKSFVRGIATEPVEWALVTAIIRLAESLGKSTVAEGIETGGQLAHLRSLRVELGQGYLFARPLSAASVSGLLAAEPGRAFQHL